MANEEVGPRKQSRADRALAEAQKTDAEPPADYAADAAGAIARTGREMSSLIGRFSEVARADMAIGQPQTVGQHTVVPLATVSVQGGFGMGFGGGSGPDANQAQSGGGGGGAGGGGRGSARIIAVADVSEAGVVVKPVPDATLIALGFMALLGLRILSGAGRGRGGLMRMIPSP